MNFQVVDKDLPASAGDRRLIPGPGRSHMLWSNKACGPQLPSLSSRARGLQPPKPHVANTEACVTNACTLRQEKPPQ